MIGQQGNCDYNIDIVMCIDGTGSMSPIIEDIKHNARSFYQKCVSTMDEFDHSLGTVRIKIIVFRDYGCDEQPMEESQFFTLPEQTEAFNTFVQGIEAKGGGDIPENALEAIALALKSDWTSSPHHRQVILVFTDAPALPLGERASSANYPMDLPKDFSELKAIWDDAAGIPNSNYRRRYGRLVIFAPNATPWNDMEEWSRCFTYFNQSGQGLSDMDVDSAIDILFGACY